MKVLGWTAVAVSLLVWWTCLPTASAAAPPGVWVGPVAHLHGGSVVRVAGWGITPGASVSVTQCDTYTGDYDYDCAPTTSVTAGTRGRVRLALTLADPVFRSEPFGDDTPVYCRADACRVFLSWTDADGTPQVVASGPLEFDGSPATISASATTDLADGQWVRVSGTAVGAAGRRVQVVEQGCFEIVQASGCYGALPARTTRVSPDGRWWLPYRVRRLLADDLTSDCADADILGQCVLSATVLLPDGTPDDSFGVARLGQPYVPLTFAAD